MKLGKVGVIVAARTQSSRLPGKALLPLRGMPMVLFLLQRLSGLKLGQVVFATTTLASDDRLVEVVGKAGVPVYRGADSDVVERYVTAAERFGFDTVARVTADCPFLDAELVDWCLGQAAGFDRFDLASTKGRFPIGLDVEIYPAAVVAKLHRSAELSADDREHLTLYFYRRKDRHTVRTIEPRSDWQLTGRSFTVDTRADYEAAELLAHQFPTPNFPINELVARAA